MFDETTQTEDQQMIAAAVAQIGKEFDHAYFLEQARKEVFPDRFWNVLTENGFLGALAPEPHGGSGFSSGDLAAFMGSMGKAGLASNVLIDTLVCCDAVASFGTPEQQQQWIPDIVAGARWTYASLERADGRNLHDITVSAVADGDSLVISGTKRYAVCADSAANILIPVRSGAGTTGSDGISLVVVPAEAAGVTIEPRQVNVRVQDEEERVRVTGDSFFDVVLSDVKVARDAVIGGIDQGGELVTRLAARQMLMMASAAIGWGDRILAMAVDYGNSRIIYEEPIGSYQAVQHPMVLAATDVEMAKLVTGRAAVAFDETSDAGELLSYASVAKYQATEAAVAACDIGVQCHGGSGFDRDTGIITYWPLVLLWRIIPLCSDKILERFSEVELGMPAN